MTMKKLMFRVVLCFIAAAGFSAAPSFAAGTSYEDAYGSSFGAGALIGIQTYGSDLGIHWSRLPVDVNGKNYSDINADQPVQTCQNADIVPYGIINPAQDIIDKSFPTAAQFAQAVGRLVERYDGDGASDMAGLRYPIKIWELINEYSSGGMSMQYPSSFDQSAYIAMMQQGYQAMKQACPDCLLAFDPFNDDDVTALLEEFSTDRIDIVAMHTYNPLDYAIDSSSDLYVGNIGQRLAKFGLTGKPVWVTEYAFYDHVGADRTAGTFPGSQTDNARWFVQTTGWGLGSGAFDKIIYTEIEPPMDAQSDPALGWMSLVDSNGAKKPVYYAMQKMISMIDLFETRQALSLGTDVYGYKFKKGSRAVYLVWSKEGTGSHTITLSGMGSASAVVTTAVPDSAGNFSSTTKALTGGTLTRSMDTTPVYIEVEETAATAPDIAVTPETLSFGTVAIGASSDPQPVVVANNGGNGLLINSTTVTAGAASFFSIASDNCTGTTLDPGASCRVTVVFTPTAAGQQTETLAISSNDPDAAMVYIPLSGTGVEPESDNTTCPATALLGDDDPRLVTLRVFRDTVLAKSVVGQAMICAYYVMAKDIAVMFEQHPPLKRLLVEALMLW